MTPEEIAQGTARRTRATPADRSKDLAPWRRANSLTKCFLYWMPMPFPASQADKQWLLRFTAVLGAELKSALQIEPFLFFQYKTAVTVHDDFVRHSQEFMPLMGLGAVPAGTFPICRRSGNCRPPSTKDAGSM